MSATQATCGGCGKTVPRDDMFGIEPDLRCEACAAGVRDRLHTRQRFTFKERTPVVTVGLLAVSAVLFLITDVIYKRSADPRVMRPEWVMDLYQGGPIWLGEWWRHATSTFVHGGIFHFGMNGLALWQLGRLMESGWGHARFLALMVATGAGGSAIAWVFSAPIPNVGISGGIFGLCGFLWALVGHHPLATAVMNPRMKNWIITMSAVFLILSVTNTFAISNAGHAGGFGLGFLLGLVSRKREAWVVPAAAVLLIAAFAVGQFATFGSTDALNGPEIRRSELRKLIVEGKQTPYMDGSRQMERGP